MSRVSIAVPEAFRYIFGAIATTVDRRKEAVMDWARILAYVILRDQLKGRLMLSDAERARLGEIGHRPGSQRFPPRSQLSPGRTTILAWYRKLVARKFSGSKAHQGPGRPRPQARRLHVTSSGAGRPKINATVAGIAVLFQGDA